MTTKKPATKIAANLISLTDAARAGVTLLRMKVWAFPDDRLEIEIVNGQLAPWATLHLPTSGPLIDIAPTKRILLVGFCDLNAKEWEPWSPPKETP
jgi:hypothetical protein